MSLKNQDHDFLKLYLKTLKQMTIINECSQKIQRYYL